MQNKHYTSKTANKKMFVAKHRLPLHTNDCVYPFLKLLILCAPARKCAEHRRTAKPANTYEEMKKQYLQLLSLVSLLSNMYINILNVSITVVLQDESFKLFITRLFYNELFSIICIFYFRKKSSRG